MTAFRSCSPFPAQPGHQRPAAGWAAASPPPCATDFVGVLVPAPVDAPVLAQSAGAAVGTEMPHALRAGTAAQRVRLLAQRKPAASEEPALPAMTPESACRTPSYAVPRRTMADVETPRRSRRLPARSPGASRSLSVMWSVVGGYPADRERSQPALHGRAHALAACVPPFRVVCDASDQDRRSG